MDVWTIRFGLPRRIESISAPAYTNDDERNERTHNLCIVSRTGTPLFRPRSTPGPPSPPVSSAFGRLSAPDDEVDDAFSTMDDVFSTAPSFPRRSRSSRRAACFSPGPVQGKKPMQQSGLTFRTDAASTSHSRRRSHRTKPVPPPSPTVPQPRR